MKAADELGIPIVIVRRPPVPSGIRVVSDVADALDWLCG
jgi:precorrin-6A/cobalt-precorrin-6A reductase